MMQQVTCQPNLGDIVAYMPNLALCEWRIANFGEINLQNAKS